MNSLYIVLVVESRPNSPDLAFTNSQLRFPNHPYHQLQYSYALSQFELDNLRSELNSQPNHTTKQESPLKLNLVSAENILSPKLYNPCLRRVFSDVIGCQKPILKGIFLFSVLNFPLQLHFILEPIKSFSVLQKPPYIFLYHQNRCLLFGLCLSLYLFFFFLFEELLSASCLKYVERLHFHH